MTSNTLTKDPCPDCDGLGYVVVSNGADDFDKIPCITCSTEPNEGWNE